MNFINLLPIDVTYAPNGDMDKAIVFPKSGLVARLTTNTGVQKTIGEMKLNVFVQQPLGELYTIDFGVDDIPENRNAFPEPTNDIVYIVNIVVAQKLTGRKDVISPAAGNWGVIRDGSKIIAVTHFNQFEVD